MSRKREFAIPGQPVDLWLTVRDDLEKRVMQPTSIGSVEIYSPTDTLLDTQTPVFANPGTYYVQWNVPSNATPGQYKDVWKDVVTPEDNLATDITQIFLVRTPTYVPVAPLPSYRISLENREIVRGAKTYLKFLLTYPKNGVFPENTFARYRFDSGNYIDRWSKINSVNNEAWALFDSEDVLVGGYKVQLRLDFDSEVLVTPEMHFSVREY